MTLMLLIAPAAAPAQAEEDLLGPGSPASAGTLPAIAVLPDFVSASAPLTEAERSEMVGVTWREGCPVGLDALSSVEVSHWGLDGAVHTGRLVVATVQAEAVVGVFQRLFVGRFPVQSIRPAREFGGDDDAMMRVNNTSAFNCRPVAGGRRYSDHSFGHALDLNPLINPYVRGSKVDPAQGRAYLTRDAAVPGLVVDPGPAVAAFAAAGWKWGGHWSSAKDYQHFSATGR
jgi:poly-gamma-glutamate synthesis protein (capsule biosynthesis protein)